MRPYGYHFIVIFHGRNVNGRCSLQSFLTAPLSTLKRFGFGGIRGGAALLGLFTAFTSGGITLEMQISPPHPAAFSSGLDPCLRATPNGARNCGDGQPLGARPWANNHQILEFKRRTVIPAICMDAAGSPWPHRGSHGVSMRFPCGISFNAASTPAL